MRIPVGLNTKSGKGWPSCWCWPTPSREGLGSRQTSVAGMLEISASQGGH